jgi:CBS domain-containing protein
MQIKDVMHKGAICVEPTTPVREIAKRMLDDDVGAIPVRANGQLVGIVTDRDITCRAVAATRDLSELTAQDVMTKNVTCCSPEDDIAAAIKTMERKKVRRLPVTSKDSGLMGMLSLGDISHKVAESLSGEVLRAVSAHHR